MEQLRLLEQEIETQWNERCLAESPEEYCRRRGRVVQESNCLDMILNKNYEDLDPSLQSLFRLCEKDAVVELYVKEFNYVYRPILPRVADVLVGVILRSSQSLYNVEISVNDVVVERLDVLYTDEPVFLSSGYILPTMFDNQVVKIDVAEDVILDLVMGNIGSEIKYAIAEYCLTRPCIWYSICYSNYDINTVPSIEMKPVNYNKCYALKKQHQLKIYNEELIRKAWHPQRLEWCLDIDESQNLLCNYNGKTRS